MNLTNDKEDEVMAIKKYKRAEIIISTNDPSGWEDVVKLIQDGYKVIRGEALSARFSDTDCSRIVLEKQE